MTKSLQTTPLPKLSMNAPEEILAAIPYLVGFHVRESVVALVLTGSRVVLTARLDAVRLDPDRDRFEATAVEITAERLRVAIEINNGDGLVLVGYHDHVRAMRELLATLACMGSEWLAEGGQGLIDVLQVSGERWYELLSPEPDADRGNSLNRDAVSTAAQAVYFGLNALPDRRSLEQAVAPPAPDQSGPLEAVFEDKEEEIAALSEEERADLCSDLVDVAASAKLAQEQYVQLAILMGYLEVRDVVLLETHVANASWRVDVWVQVIRHSIAGHQAGPLGVLAMTAWLSGNGALQVICIQRLREVAPNYRLLKILEQINAAALPPSCWGPVETCTA